MNRLELEIKNSELVPVEEAKPGALTKRYCFSPDFIGFSGHFPGYPILPALVQLKIGVILAEENEGRSLHLESVERARFLLEIHPEQEISAQCKKRLLKGRLGAEVNITLGGSVASSAVLIFRGVA